MTVEFASYISQLDTTLPTAADLISEGDDHLRLTKTVLKTQFPNFGTTAIAASAAEVNYSVGVTSSIQTQINGKGAITGQAWTGAHSFAGATSVPTLAAGSNTTGAASTAFVQADFLQKFPNYTAPVNASTTELNYLVGLTGAIQPQLSNQVSGPINAAISKTTPVDADELGLSDSAALWGLKKLTFANLKTWLSGLFVGTTGAQVMAGGLTTASLTTSGAVSASGSILAVGAGALGYGVGSGGTVTQAPSKSTAVTLNKPSGKITMHNEALAPGAQVAYTLTNSFVSAADTVVATIVNSSCSAGAYALWVSAGPGFFNVYLKNISAGSLSESLAFNYTVIKGAAS